MVARQDVPLYKRVPVNVDGKVTCLVWCIIAMCNKIDVLLYRNGVVIEVNRRQLAKCEIASSNSLESLADMCKTVLNKLGGLAPKFEKYRPALETNVEIEKCANDAKQVRRVTKSVTRSGLTKEMDIYKTRVTNVGKVSKTIVKPRLAKPNAKKVTGSLKCNHCGRICASPAGLYNHKKRCIEDNGGDRDMGVASQSLVEDFAPRPPVLNSIVSWRHFAYLMFNGAFLMFHHTRASWSMAVALVQSELTEKSSPDLLFALFHHIVRTGELTTFARHDLQGDLQLGDMSWRDLACEFWVRALALREPTRADANRRRAREVVAQLSDDSFVDDALFVPLYNYLIEPALENDAARTLHLMNMSA